MHRAASLVLLAIATIGCSSEKKEPKIIYVTAEGGTTAAPTAGGGAGGSSGASAGTAGAGGTVAAPGGNGGSTVVQIGGNSAGGEAGAGPACAAVHVETGLSPVYLAFAFDVSGSMGQGDQPWHDRSLKWEPVVAATRAFLEDPSAEGLTASMAFFPAEREDERCDDETYQDPDIEMTALPSTEFGEALDEIGEQEWRGGTPTLAVVRGTYAYVREQQELNPGKYVVVLVTDGHPQGCGEDDGAIAALAEVVGDVAAEVPTYVIGVRNPPLDGAPDTTSGLQRIAVAGNTESAYMIDTGEPDRTAESFREAIDTIRGSAISCSLDIPAAPDGRTFDKESVVVRHRSGASSVSFTYDPACEEESGWHYDDVVEPTQIILCESACTSLTGDFEAELEVEFACERVLEIPE